MLRPRGAQRHAHVNWAAALCIAILILLILNPGGYIGGGQDDWRYLRAVRCWREHGPCLPYNHWQSRWPLIAPSAALTSLFGESRLTISLAPLAASVTALFVLAFVGNKLIGRPIGWLGALLFAAVPAFSFQFTDLNVEATELLFIFAGFLAVLCWEEEGWPPLGVAAGISLSLAFQTRETSAVAIIFALIYVLFSRGASKVRFLIYAAIGLSLPLVAEFATFAISTGNPLWRRELALDHTLIPSSELLGPVDPNHTPFFNLAYIAHWRRISGIHVHWLVDWLLNLVVSGFAGLSLLLVPLLLMSARKRLDRRTKRLGLSLWLTALAYGAVLALAFAVDPKPRMMLVPLALSSLALALLTWRLRQSGRGFIAYACWAAILLLWIPLHAGHRRTDILEARAERWIREHEGEVEIDENTRRHLALVPEAATLPTVNAGRPYLLYMSESYCNELVGSTGLPQGAMSPIESAPTNQVYLDKRGPRPTLCLLRIDRPTPGPQIIRAIRQSRRDGPYITGYGGT